MPHRAHLFSLRIAHALREACFGKPPYRRQDLHRDLLAGGTVGIIAIPLSMALAIASGVAPQYGLYTAIIAGIVIAVSGGSRFSISGPTAAFVVILAPISAQYGLAGLLLATLMAGILLIFMAWARLGRLIEYIPESVTLGFTGGIAVVIATLQLKDVFGLQLADSPSHYLQKVLQLGEAIPQFEWPSLSVAALTLGLILLWRRLKTTIPPHLPAVVAGTLLAWYFNQRGLHVGTIGSRFSYPLPDGTLGQGIPPYLPNFDWPWHRAGADGEPLVVSWSMIADLLPAAFTIAMLGAIESLLCAVVLDGMSGKKHSANSELLGQGLGNLLAPLFGGITATAAIARSAANLKAGAVSPLAAAFHGLVVLFGLIFLAPWLAYLPMPGMAALLLMVAWNMSEAPKAIRLLRTAPRGDVAVFLCCLLLTVFFDMVIAVTTGILLASVLFMREIANMTKVSDVTDNTHLISEPLPEGWRVFKVNGPLFFAAAEKIFGELAFQTKNLRGVVLYLEAVPILDAGGVSAMNKLVSSCIAQHTQLYFCEWQFQPLRTLARAETKPLAGQIAYFANLQEGLAAARATQNLTENV